MSIAGVKGGPLSRFTEWWGEELAAMLPGDRARGEVRPRGRWLVLAYGAAGTRLLDEAAGRTRCVATGSAGDGTALTDELDRLAAARRRPRVAVRLAPHQCLVRRVELPDAALRDAGRILALDLERTTPFKLDDVVAAYAVDEATPATRTGHTTVLHVIARRDILARARQPLAAAGLEVERVECWDAGEQRVLPVDLLAAERPQESPRTAPRLLALTATALAIAAALVAIDRHETALAGLEARAGELREQLSSLGAERRARAGATGDLAALRDLASAEISRALVIDQVTRVLPDTDFLTSLRIDHRDIEVQGYSVSAAALVALFERADAFAGAALSAPVTFDARVGKERFALKATLVAPAGQSAAATARGAP